MEILPYLLSPKTRGWIVAPNYDMCDKIARLVKEAIMMKLRFPIVAKKDWTIWSLTRLRASRRLPGSNI